MRYEYYNNCNFTQIGDAFGEQPYAVAVQQGSYLHEEISKAILRLQKKLYFEKLSGIMFHQFVYLFVTTQKYLSIV